VQNTDDRGVRRQNSRRYHHDYSKKENKSTEQTTQSATRFPMNELPQPQFPTLRPVSRRQRAFSIYPR
jgi:hypothetical protein